MLFIYLKNMKLKGIIFIPNYNFITNLLIKNLNKISNEKK